MARMRTMPKAAEYFKQKDPDTDISLHGIRMKVMSGELPHIKIGNKHLIDLDVAERFFSCEYTPPQAKSEPFGVVRQLPERITKFGG